LYTQGNNSYGRGQKSIISMRNKNRIKSKIEINKPMRAWKYLVSMINSVNQQNPKLNKTKSKEKYKQDSIWKKQSNMKK
jgi:hypothetical protein